MIHYTLLPEKEIKTLKREYRTRLVIILFFFICFAVLVGIVSLFPAYIFSAMQEKEVQKSLEDLKSERQGTGVGSILKELNETNDLVKRIDSNKTLVVASEMINRVILSKTGSIRINSFQFTSATDANKKATSTTVTIVIQGHSNDRESLVNFKDSLVANPIFTKVELPVSDLTKSKNIPFSIRLTTIPKI